VLGRSVLAGKHQGSEEIAKFIRNWHDKSAGSLQPFGEDISISDHHGVLMYAVRAQCRDEAFVSHEIIVGGLGEDAIEIHFLYVFEHHKFDEFWS
jgi:hypothetical protein